MPSAAPDDQRAAGSSDALVSVCITTYNHGAFIEQCLRSVLAQQFDGHLEVLVGDDGSRDDTRGIVRRLADEFPGVVIPVFNETNLGPSGNLKALVARTSGQFIAHLDGDDFWMPGKLREQLDRLGNSDDCVAVYANAIVTTDGETALGLFNCGVPASFDMGYLLERGNFIHHGSLLYRASLRELVCGIEGEFVDYRVHLRLASRGTLGYIDRPLSAYRWRSTTSMTRHMTDLVHLGYWQALSEAEGLGADPRQVDKAAALLWQKLFSDAAMNGSWPYIRRWWGMLRGKRKSLGSARMIVLAALSPLPALRRWWFREHRRPAIFFAR
jgi:glycosyltransferase involved in cell wall biosynthesis